jgi:hypothetical protein
VRWGRAAKRRAACRDRESGLRKLSRSEQVSHYFMIRSQPSSAGQSSYYSTYLSLAMLGTGKFTAALRNFRAVRPAQLDLTNEPQRSAAGSVFLFWAIRRFFDDMCPHARGRTTAAVTDGAIFVGFRRVPASLYGNLPYKHFVIRILI